MTVRRLVVRLLKPTRDGDREIVLLTNLPAEVATALQVAELYLGRWRIEKAFNHITLAYNCEIKPLCYPRAALFCFAIALVAYNAVSIVHATIAIEHSRENAAMMSHFAGRFVSSTISLSPSRVGLSNRTTMRRTVTA